LEIIIDLPFGFPINNIISLSGEDVQSQKKTGEIGQKAAKICGDSGPTPEARGWLRG